MEDRLCPILAKPIFLRRNSSGLSLNAARTAWQILTGAVKTVSQWVLFITGSAGAGKWQRIGSLCQLWSSGDPTVKTICSPYWHYPRSQFKTAIQHRWPGRHLLTVHIRSKWPWGMCASGSEAMPTCLFFPGLSIWSGRSCVRRHLRAWKVLHRLRLYRYAQIYR